jgi:hypothetical protein
MSPDLQLLRPERAAHATIRGFLYQTCLGVQRWFELAPEPAVSPGALSVAMPRPCPRVKR